MESVTRAILFSLSWYKKYLSPLLPPACRFWPTCSEYSYQAIRKYGVFKGTVLSAKRLSRCHPFHAGGHDPLV